MRPVADLVGGPVRPRVLIARDRDLGPEIGMGGVDLRVDDADLHALAAAQVPGGGKALARQVPLVGGAARRERVLLGEGRVTGLEAQLVLGLGLDAADGAVPLELRGGLRKLVPGGTSTVMTPTCGTSGRARLRPLRASTAAAEACTADLDVSAGSRSTSACRGAAPACAAPGSTKRATTTAASPVLTPLIS